MAAEIPEEARKVLEQPNFAHVATLMEDGSPQLTPVWVKTDDGHVTFNTAKGRLKEKNLRRDPRLAISITPAGEEYSPLLIRGKMVEITEEGADEDIDALAKKYLDEDTYPFREPGEQRLIVTVEPEKVSYGQ